VLRLAIATNEKYFYNCQNKTLITFDLLLVIVLPCKLYFKGESPVTFDFGPSRFAHLQPVKIHIHAPAGTRTRNLLYFLLIILCLFLTHICLSIYVHYKNLHHWMNLYQTISPSLAREGLLLASRSIF